MNAFSLSKKPLIKNNGMITQAEEMYRNLMEEYHDVIELLEKLKKQTSS
ncbi:MAG: hypothetical protein FWD78_06825 [Treponema sp.]|nr:hypothetical protein [Treponema sp.]